MIITIDGPVGTGKSTLAKRLAERLRFLYFDTGAMYRCLTYAVLKSGIDPKNRNQLNELLNNFSYDLKLIRENPHYFFESEEITHEIRKEAVTRLVSEISAIPEVRSKLVELQRRLSIGKNAVFEGRDMGSFVFPDAEIKFFLTASAEVRARRRFLELKTAFPEESAQLCFDQVLESVNERDRLDSTREQSPLKKAKDAIVVDTSELSIEEVLDRLTEISIRLGA